MKTITLSLLACCILPIFVLAQCPVDSTMSAETVSPKTLAAGSVGTSYAKTIKFCLNKDTTFNFPPVPITIPFDSFAIAQIVNLPAGLTFTCPNVFSCNYNITPGGNGLFYGCFNISGIPTATFNDSLKIVVLKRFTFLGIPNLIVDTFKVKLKINSVACTPASLPVINAAPASVCKNKNTTLSIQSGNLNGNTTWKWYKDSCGGTFLGTGNSIVSTITATTIFYARGEDGCVTKGACGNKTVTMKAIPATAISGNHLFCANDTLSLIASPTAPGYLWSNGKTTSINKVTTGGVFTVTVTNSGGCSKSLSATVVAPKVITVVKTIVNESVAGAHNGSAMVTPSGSYAPYTFLWANGTTKNKRTNLSAGTFSVTITDSIGCKVIKFCTVGIGPRLAGNLENNSETDWSAVPNPANDAITFSSKFIESDSEINIYDSNGKLIESYFIKESDYSATFKLTTTQYAKGVYLAQIKSGDNFQSIKFIVNH